MIATAAVVALMLAVFAAPMSAAPNKTQLSGASVTPRTGTTKTTIVISVVYTNLKNSRAEWVIAKVGGMDLTMTAAPGGDWGHGVTFRWSGTLPLGTHTVVLTARAKDHSEATLAAGTVQISAKVAPAPKPPAPKATPKPTPKPTARPATRTTPRPTSRPAPTVTLAAEATPSAYDDANPPPDEALPSADPGPPLLTAAVVGAVGGGSGPGGSDPGGTDVPTDPRSGAGGGKGKPWSPIASVLAIAGLSGPTFPALSLAPTLVTTSGAVATAMAFGLFGRRRRDDEFPDDVLAAAAATGINVGPQQLVGSMIPMPAPASGMGSGIGDARTVPPLAPQDDEALLPRWRRPSLLQARKTDPIRDSAPVARLTFGDGLVGPLAGRERRVIRYRVVRLLDSPDELRGAEIGYLDQGDEVQLIEKYGAYWLVLSPDGQQGWLHKMVLGEVVDADGPSSDVPVATMPAGADSWTMGESDIDGDVFAAYLESRRREA